MAKETKMLKNEEAKKLGKPATKGLKAAETKKLPVSKTRAKKIKHSYKVKDAENELYKDKAPITVNNFISLAQKGFYDGLKFHRVIDGFMAQTGCPYGNGTGGTGKKLKAEFNRNPHKRGTVSMARAMNPDSGDSQFFICFADCPWLDGQYTVWGEVTSGMEFVDLIKRGEGQNGTVYDPDEIISMSVIADL